MWCYLKKSCPDIAKKFEAKPVKLSAWDIAKGDPLCVLSSKSSRDKSLSLTGPGLSHEAINKQCPLYLEHFGLFVRSVSPSYPRPLWPIPTMASSPTPTPSPSPPLNMATPTTSSMVPAPILHVRCPSSKAETGKNAHSQWALVGIAPNLATPISQNLSSREGFLR